MSRRHNLFVLCTIVAAGLVVPGADAAAPKNASSSAKQPSDNSINPEDAKYTRFKISDEEIITGRADAPITIITYLSPECGYCASWLDQTYRLLSEHILPQGSVRHVLRFVRLTSAKQNPKRHAALEQVLTLLKPSRGLTPNEAIAQFRKLLGARSTWMTNPDYLHEFATTLDRKSLENRKQRGGPEQTLASAITRRTAVFQDEQEIAIFWFTNTPKGQPLKGGVPVSFVARTGLNTGNSEIYPDYHVAGFGLGSARKLFDKINAMTARANKGN